MRRPLSSSLPDFFGEKPPDLRPPSSAWTASFTLKTITPVVGGGVETLEPDEVDVVRVPGIRGQLRWWWRTLYQKAGEKADALFRREAELWGGVGVTGDDDESRALRGRVRLRVDVEDAGRVAPAGTHEPKNDGKLQAMPTWNVGQGLGYALFPLQRSQEERNHHRGSSPLPTRSVRTGLRFRLTAEVVGPEPGTTPRPGEVAQLLATIWAWVHLGGLGARTRRGFGALMAEKVELGQLEGDRGSRWRALFDYPGREGIERWLTELGRLSRPTGERVAPLVVMVGRARPNHESAHSELIQRLFEFRQGKNVGRDRGGQQPGQSRWPEPHLLRLLRDPEGGWNEKYDHAPPEEVQEIGNELGAPRAAFGLPILVQFKDRQDLRANATLLPPDGDRWSSPLLLRPLVRRDGRCEPLAVILGGPKPTQVRVDFEKLDGTPPVRTVASAAGSRPPIEAALLGASGDALEAFARWLSGGVPREHPRTRAPLPGDAYRKISFDFTTGGDR